jgi:hypothetical protein
MSLRRYNMEVFIVNSIVCLELSNEFWRSNKIKDSIVFVSYKLIKGSERDEVLKIKRTFKIRSRFFKEFKRTLLINLKLVYFGI